MSPEITLIEKMLKHILSLFFYLLLSWLIEIKKLIWTRCQKWWFGGCCFFFWFFSQFSRRWSPNVFVGVKLITFKKLADLWKEEKGQSPVNNWRKKSKRKLFQLWFILIPHHIYCSFLLPLKWLFSFRIGTKPQPNPAYFNLHLLVQTKIYLPKC